MKTIIRLLLIAGIISIARGPLQTFKTDHPQAWNEAMGTLKSIPQTLGQLLTKEAALLPKTPPPSLNQNGSTHSNLSSSGENATSSSSQNPNLSTDPNSPNRLSGSLGTGSQTNPSSTQNPSSSNSVASQSQSQTSANQSLGSASSQGVPSTQNSGVLGTANTINWISEIFKSFLDPKVSSPTAKSNPNSSSTLSTAVLSRFVSDSALSQGPLKDVEIDGFNQTDVSHVMTHMMGLDLIQVLPKLQALSTQLSSVSVQGQPLSARDQETVKQTYNQAMALLSMSATFTLQKDAHSSKHSVTLSQLLNERGLSHDQVNVQLTDAKSHAVLATFSLKAKPTSSDKASGAV